MARRTPLSRDLFPSFGNWVPKAQTCQIGPFAFGLRGWPGESPRSVPQVSGAEAEPSLGMEEKQLWGRRLEHLQEAVAQLEIDRSRLQRHNMQLRATLEQVRPFSGPQLPRRVSGAQASWLRV